MKIHLFHSIRWSRYKARVFSSLYHQAASCGVNIYFTQIADTMGERESLSEVDLDFHQYPHELLFPGSYDNISKGKITFVLFQKVMQSDAKLILIPGFDKLEYWAMLFATLLSGKNAATFCDSTLRDRRQSKFKGILKKIFFSRSRGVFCYGERAKNYLLYYGVNEDRIHRRRQAAALPTNYSPVSALEQRVYNAALTLAPRFLYVGRLSAEKGLDTLITAFSKVLSTAKGAKLVVVGGGPDLAALRSITVALGVESSVEFLGGKDQTGLATEYSMATCLVLPSLSEPWGLVVNEALHYGCPVVVSDRCGCVPELVREGLTGYTFRAGDPEDLANKLEMIITEFNEVDRTASICLETISSYTPAIAATEMLEGCYRMAASPG